MPRGLRFVTMGLIVAVAGCGGGGTSTSPSMQPRAGTAAAASGKATLTIQFPAHFAVARAAAAQRRSPAATRNTAYVNPTTTDYLFISVNGVAAPESPIAVASGAGISQTASVSVLSGTYASNAVEVTERDGNTTSTNVVADGFNANGFSLTAGGQVAIAVTMQMNASRIALTTDPVAGNDALILAGTNPPTLFCMPILKTRVYAFAADPSSGFVLPGTAAGGGGIDPNGYPGIPTPALTNATSTGTSSLAALVFGFQTVPDASLSAITATFSVANPAAVNDPGLVTSGSPSLGYAKIGMHASTDCPIGQITSYASPTVASNPYGVTTGPDGNIWFTENLGNNIARVTPKGAITEFAIPTASAQPLDIASGPDGNLWFAEYGASKVGRITPSGSITEFTVAGTPYAIAAGPDGNVWFTNFANGTIGRITPAGVISEFAPTTPASVPLGIATGPDGNLWFTESAVDQIGVMTPSGATVAEYHVGNALHLTNIVRGPDGLMWFCEEDTDSIGKITTAGALTTYLLGPGTGTLGILGIASGPDGNLWYTEAYANQIGRITTSGASTLYATSPANGPGLIALGPDNNLWYASSGSNRFANIAP